MDYSVFDRPEIVKEIMESEGWDCPNCDENKYQQAIKDYRAGMFYSSEEVHNHLINGTKPRSDRELNPEKYKSN
jgi:hypothetical protein